MLEACARKRWRDENFYLLRAPTLIRNRANVGIILEVCVSDGGQSMRMRDWDIIAHTNCVQLIEQYVRETEGFTFGAVL